MTCHLHIAFLTLFAICQQQQRRTRDRATRTSHNCIFRATDLSSLLGRRLRRWSGCKWKIIGWRHCSHNLVASVAVVVPSVWSVCLSIKRIFYHPMSIVQIHHRKCVFVLHSGRYCVKSKWWFNCFRSVCLFIALIYDKSLRMAETGMSNGVNRTRKIWIKFEFQFDWINGDDDDDDCCLVDDGY